MALQEYESLTTIWPEHCPLSVFVDITAFIRRFSEAHSFTKPNDADALELMNHAARHVCQELKGEVTLAFGESDEYR